MPSKHRVINYQPLSHYHIYNRGNNLQPIFREERDFWAFRKILKKKLNEMPEITLLAFALLPNHFHFQIFQQKERDIVRFMRSFSTRYTLYFRKKYGFTGRVFGSSYHAVFLQEHPDIRANQRYILENPLHAGQLSWRHVGASP